MVSLKGVTSQTSKFGLPGIPILKRSDSLTHPVTSKLSESDKARFAAHCGALEMSEAELLRDLIQRELEVPSVAPHNVAARHLALFVGTMRQSLPHESEEGGLTVDGFEKMIARYAPELVEKDVNAGAVERVEAGNRGPFPVRFPLGKAAGFLLALGLMPAWWGIGRWATSPLEKFYAGTYWASLKDQVHIGPSQPIVVSYRLLVWGSKEAPMLVGPTAMEKYGKQVREQDVAVGPKELHGWLKSNVYPGGFFRMFYFPVSAIVITFMAGVMLGMSLIASAGCGQSRAAFGAVLAICR